MKNKTQKLLARHYDEMLRVRWENSDLYPKRKMPIGTSCAVFEGTKIKIEFDDHDLKTTLDNNKAACKILQEKVLEAIKLIDKKSYKRIITIEKEQSVCDECGQEID